MIAVLLIKDVDERLAAHSGRIFTPEDVLKIAVDLHDMDAYQRADPRQRDRRDWLLPKWEEASPERRWAFWHRAAQAVANAEAQRRPPEAPALDPTDPERAVARADLADALGDPA